MTIDPSTCKPDVPYWVRVPEIDRDVIGQRIDHSDEVPWSILSNYGERGWHYDNEVTVIRRADQQPTADGESLAQLVRDVRDAPDQGHTAQIDGVLIAKCDTYGRVAAHLAQPPTDWEILRQAGALLDSYGYYHAAHELADRLEAKHTAEQEKAAADARREALIEKAIARFSDDLADYAPDDHIVRAVAESAVDALLAEAVES